MSLRTRIAFAAAAAVAAVAILLGAIGYFTTKTKLVDQVRTQLRQRAAPFLTPHPENGQQSNDGDHELGGNEGSVCSAGSHFEISPPELGGAPGYFQSVCPNGVVVAAQGGIPQLPVTPKVLAIARQASGQVYFTDEVEHTRVEILAIGDQPDHKAIEVALPLTTVDSTLHGLLLTFLVLAGIGVGLAGVAGLLIARGAVAPILHFSDTTEEVTSALEHPRRLEETGPQELRRLAASFNQTLEALERSVEAQRHLIADASHELRTPMAALRSNIQIFLEAERLPKDEREDLQRAIVEELDDLTQLVSDVLELARGANLGDYTEQIELDTIVHEVVERTQRRAPNLGFELDLEPTVISNSPERVSRAITNVIENARKWSPEGAGIEVSLHDGVLAVRDHGPGFNESDLDHVFDRFYRSAQARRMPGSGLGLAIVKQAAEVHGGFASAANAPDGGALVRVSFGPSAGPGSFGPSAGPGREQAPAPPAGAHAGS